MHSLIGQSHAAALVASRIAADCHSLQPRGPRGRQGIDRPWPWHQGASRGVHGAERAALFRGDRERPRLVLRLLRWRVQLRRRRGAQARPRGLPRRQRWSCLQDLCDPPGRGLAGSRCAHGAHRAAAQRRRAADPGLSRGRHSRHQNRPLLAGDHIVRADGETKARPLLRACARLRAERRSPARRAGLPGRAGDRPGSPRSRGEAGPPAEACPAARDSAAGRPAETSSARARPLPVAHPARAAALTASRSAWAHPSRSPPARQNRAAGP